MDTIMNGYGNDAGIGNGKGEVYIGAQASFPGP